MNRTQMNSLVGKVAILREATILNDVGGTTVVRGHFKVRVDQAFMSREIGARFIGTLTADTDMAPVRKAGTTGHTPEDYLQYEGCNPGMVARTAEAAEAFKTCRTVFFGEQDVRLARKPWVGEA